MNALTNYLENAWLDNLFRAVALPTWPAALHFGLFTAPPGETGGGTEVSGNAYARVSVTRNTGNFKDPSSATQGEVKNLGAITFPQATGSWGTIRDVGIFDAASAGNLLIYGPLIAAPKVFTGLASSDVITSYAHGFSDGDEVRLFGSALPTGVAEGTTYYVRDSTTDTFKLAATSGGAAIDLTVSGAGHAAKLTPKVISNLDTFSFAINNFTFSLN